MERLNVKCYTNSIVTAIDGSTVTIHQGEETFTLTDIDNIILAAGYRSENALAKEVENSGYAVISIGDASSVKSGHYNILEGFEAAVNLQ